MTRPLWRLAAVVLLVLASARSAAAQPAHRILVMPFENVARDNQLVWLGEAAAVLLADDLNALGARAITREERREAFAYLQIPQTAPLSDAMTIRIGQLLGASRVVLGTLRRSGDSLVVQARSITLDTGRVQQSEGEGAPIGDLFALFERLASRLVLPADGVSTPAARPPYPSVLAFENYIKGLLAETPTTALNYLSAALKAQPTFDRARLAMWEVYDEQGDHERALASVVTIQPSSPNYRRARFLVGLAQLNLRRYDDAFRTLKAMADALPSAPVMNNLGVVQLRRAGTTQTGQPVFYFNRAIESDGTDADYFFNLGYAYWLQRDYSAAIYWLREAVRRAPADGEAHYVLSAALAANNGAQEAARERDLARRLSADAEAWAKRPAAEAVPRGLERVKQDPDLLRIDRVETAITSAGLRDQQELVRFYLDRGRRLFEQERDREATAELNRVLFLSPYDADAHLLIGRILLRAGRPRDAIDEFKIAVWSRPTDEAHALLARGYLDDQRPDDAVAEAQRALALNPASRAAAAVLEDAGQR